MHTDHSQLAKIRRDELIAEAARERLARAGRPAAAQRERRWRRPRLIRVPRAVLERSLP